MPLRSTHRLALVALAAACGSAWAEEARPPAAALPGQPSSQWLGQDPLMKEILRQQLKEPNGGVKGFAAPLQGPPVLLELGDMGARPAPPKSLGPKASGTGEGLQTHPDLVAKKDPPPAKRKPPAKASEQLRTLDRQGDRQDWGEGSKRVKRSAGAKNPPSPPDGDIQ